MTTDHEIAVAVAHGQFDAQNGVPDATSGANRRAALNEIYSLLGREVDVAWSPLGVEWTDVFVVGSEHRPSSEVLRRHGWVALEGLLGWLDQPEDRWAVIEGGQVLAAVSFTNHASTPRREYDRVIQRCLAAREVTLRDAMELRALVKQADPSWLPLHSPYLTAAADIEVALGTRDLVRWTSGGHRLPPVPLDAKAGRRLVVAVSGVDGSGKSSVVNSLRRDLAACGVPTSRVWLRPGMDLGRLASLAQQIKKIRRWDSQPGVARLAADPDLELHSRRGVTGRAWKSLVLAQFIRGVWRQHRRSHGVVVYDRHRLDALVTLNLLYQATDRWVPRQVLRHLVPPARMSFFLDLTADQAAARKPGDLVGQRAIARQVELYHHVLQDEPQVQVLDAERPLDEINLHIFTSVASLATSQPVTYVKGHSRTEGPSNTSPRAGSGTGPSIADSTSDRAP